MKTLNSFFPAEHDLISFGKEIAIIAGKYDIQVATCAENIDLSSCGIEHNCCIDKELIEKIIGYKIRADKDKNQSCKLYDVNSPILCGIITENDKITERKVY